MKSVLAAFGHNLKLLCGERGSQSAVADVLGISKVQFQRYLKGESFPKPNLLHKICAYFGVDARILTDPLTPEDMVRLRGGQNPYLDQPPHAAMAEAASYANRSEHFFGADPALPDGFYLVWRHAMSHMGKVSCTLQQVRTLARSRVVKAYDLKAAGARDPADNAARAREFRGILHRQTTGAVVVYYHEEPWNMVALTYINRIGAMNADTIFAGFSVLCRDELPGMRRMSRCAWQRVDGNCAATLAAARRRGLYDAAQVPRSIMGLIAQDLE